MRPRSQYGFTRLDALICLASLLMLGFWAVALPHFSRGKATNCRVRCESNLQQIGLGFRMWANDHNDTFPWAVSTAYGGTRELVNSPQVYMHFLAASNELYSPRILACPQDSARTRANDWANFSNLNLSYFVALDTTNAIHPASLLSGDRLIGTNGLALSGIATLRTRNVRPLSGLHDNETRILLADGSVSRLQPRQLSGIFTNLPINIAFP